MAKIFSNGDSCMGSERDGLLGDGVYGGETGCRASDSEITAVK